MAEVDQREIAEAAASFASYGPVDSMEDYLTRYGAKGSGK